MPVPEKPSSNSATLAAAGWSGVVLAAIALAGLTTRHRCERSGSCFCSLGRRACLRRGSRSAGNSSGSDGAMPTEPKRARRILDIVGGIAAVVAILGLIFARDLIYLWAFLLLFGITTVPERAIGHLRQRWRECRARTQ